MAPVAPDGADVEQNGLILGLGPSESLRAPFVPIYRLVAGRAQVGTRGFGQAAFGFFVHDIPSQTLDMKPRGVDFLTGSGAEGGYPLDRSAYGRKNLRLGDDRNGCGPLRGASTDRLLH